MKTSKRRATTTTSIADDSLLPIEIIFEILIRLPVKILLKMGSVSKSWASLISSPQFIKTHLKLSTNNPEFAYHRLLSIRSGLHTNDDRHFFSWTNFRTYSLYSILYEESPRSLVELHNFGNSVGISYEVLGSFDDSVRVNYKILGSCDGLFIISTTSYCYIEDMFLWNPSIRKLRKLPFSGRDLRNDTRVDYGFGYIECQNDYKIVQIVASKSNSEIVGISIYSLRSNSWKRIRIQEYPSIYLTEPVKFVKGNLHWITGGGSDRKATWFNPGDQTFGNVALPNPSGDTFNWK
ncbi:hypothetical protein HAX54_041364 [Datura stramonium]|uniref:F-box domain-containing protein n=1 Tax=Datura stramonium TaxID=4076 RepID=A0ABS8VQG3_DATST|nr:hypothetical protein [Datura stramonium]